MLVFFWASGIIKSIKNTTKIKRRIKKWKDIILMPGVKIH